jgi:hypothetical protein
MTRLRRVASQCLLGLATLLGCLAVVEWVVQMFDRRLLFLQGYEPFRLLEIAAVALVFVIALRLWDDERSSGTPKG